MYKQGIEKIVDIVNDQKNQLLTDTQYREKFGNNSNFMAYHSVMAKIPKSWREQIKRNKSKFQIIPSKSEKLKNSKISTTKTIYSQLNRSGIEDLAHKM